MNRFFVRKSIFGILCSLALISCSKGSETPSATSEARYLITVTGKWTSPAFGIPTNAHYTTFVGMVHNDKTVLWKDGSLASPGIELLAEIGNGTTLLNEINGNIAAGNTSALLLFLPPDLTGTITTNAYCNNNFAHISFAAMLAPTPDWFVGVSDLNLYPNNKWVTDTTIQLYAYDAGTEDGDRFDMNNLPTSPQQTIKKLSVSEATVLANGNATLSPIASVRFLKQ